MLMAKFQAASPSRRPFGLSVNASAAETGHGFEHPSLLVDSALP